jgi:hypothetical protein
VDQGFSRGGRSNDPDRRRRRSILSSAISRTGLRSAWGLWLRRSLSRARSRSARNLWMARLQALRRTARQRECLLSQETLSLLSGLKRSAPATSAQRDRLPQACRLLATRPAAAAHARWPADSGVPPKPTLRAPIRRRRGERVWSRPGAVIPGVPGGSVALQPTERRLGLAAGSDSRDDSRS